MYETSVQELVGLDLGLDPFFETAARDRYGSLWLPTKIDFRGLDSAYSSSSLLKQGGNLWFMIGEGFPSMTNLERILSGSFKSFRATSTISENTERNEKPSKNTRKKPRKLGQDALSFRGERFGLFPQRNKIRFSERVWVSIATSVSQLAYLDC